MKAKLIKKVLLLGTIMLIGMRPIYSQNNTYYPFKSEEPIDSRVLWPAKDEIQVWFLIPFAEQEYPDSLRSVLHQIINRISDGKVKCYSSSLRCQHMPLEFASYTLFKDALRSKCKEEFHPDTPSVCDTSLMVYYGKAFLGYYTRNIKTGKFRFGTELVIVGYDTPIMPAISAFSVDLKDIKDIKIKAGISLNSWLNKMQYFHVPTRMKEKNGETSFCDCENREAISILSETLRKGKVKEIEEIKEKFHECGSFTTQPLNAYKF